MKKIIITGGLGYIGTELCKLYARESHIDEIIVIDNRFLSERVKYLQDLGIKFVHGDILNKGLMKSILKKADLIYHLAGITDVAYNKKESNLQKDELIREVGIEGSRNVIDFSPKNAKIVFPSSHVIYEGYKETKFYIKEEDKDTPPWPVLVYAAGKYLTEKHLSESGKNYIILRLGSAYGYSNDSMRINIMPNLFSKIASQDGTIKLFGGGKQHKSLISVFDIARCLKFVGENEDINKEIFNCTNENLTVKEVAEICKSFNPKVNIVETTDEVPNLGYTLSNEKLLDTGFEFKFNVQKCIEEMIKNWSILKINDSDLEYKIFGEKEYIDYRGKISNYELYEPINWIGTITSKAGTVRANHYHPVQTQQVLLISGKYISVIKDLNDPKAVISTMLVKAGDLVVTKPNVAHTMVFIEDSIILNLVNGEREHENFGVHTIPYELVDNRLSTNLLSTYKDSCRCCRNKNLKRILNLGLSPLANNLLDKPEQKSDLYPLELDYCRICHNVQLSYAVPSEKMFDNYLYVSSTSQSFVNHFEEVANKYIEKFKLNEDSYVIDIGSNDGIALKPFIEKGIKCIGVEPAKNIAKIANDNGIETINLYFGLKGIHNHPSFTKKADIILASNVFAHADDLESIALNAFRLLKDGGQFIIEVQYLLDVIKNLTFDNIYHEHFNYWSVTSLSRFFKKMGASILDIEHIDTHGGSIRVYIGKTKTEDIKNSVYKFLNEEKEFGLLNFDTYKDFAKKVESTRERVNSKIKKLKDEGNIIYGYGAPAKATTLLNYYGITNKEIDLIIEDNKFKHNKYIPGIKISIMQKEEGMFLKPDKILVFAWNFINEIKENNKDFRAEFISIKDL